MPRSRFNTSNFTLETEEDADIGLDDPVEVALSRTPRLRSEEELAVAFPNWRRDLQCPDCGNLLVLKDGKYGIFYGCVKWSETGCKGSHNCHKGTAEPLGVPADAETRLARKRAHDVFDTLWRDKGLGRMSRKQAYEWLETKLGVFEGEYHIAQLDKAGCEKLIEAVNRFQNPPNRLDRILGDDVI